MFYSIIEEFNDVVQPMEGVTRSFVDHDYLYSCGCTDNCSCFGCHNKQGQINHLISQLDQ